MSSMSYQEKSLYGTLAADLVVYVPYAVYALSHRASLGRIVAALAVLIVLQIVLQSIIAAASRSRLTDERDRIIQLRGYRAGYLTLVSCVFTGMMMLWVHTSLGQLNPSHLALHFISVLFSLVVCAELVKVVTQLLAYRRPL